MTRVDPPYRRLMMVISLALDEPNLSSQASLGGTIGRPALSNRCFGFASCILHTPLTLNDVLCLISAELTA